MELEYSVLYEKYRRDFKAECLKYFWKFIIRIQFMYLQVVFITFFLH